MAYYRWTVLEERLVTHSDLRLGFGKYASQAMSDLKRRSSTVCFMCRSF